MAWLHSRVYIRPKLAITLAEFPHVGAHSCAHVHSRRVILICFVGLEAKQEGFKDTVPYIWDLVNDHAFGWSTLVLGSRDTGLAFATWWTGPSLLWCRSFGTGRAAAGI